MSATLELHGARWSSAVLCPRRAVYDYQDAPQDEPDQQTEQWRRRGHAVEDVVVREELDSFRRRGERPRTQEVIPWPASDPIGEGHADAFIPSQAGIVEITSTAGARLAPHKALQAAGYALEHPRAEKAVVVSIDPSTWDRRVYPIDLAGLEPRIREIQETVVEGARSGVLPERTCRTPFDGPARFCPYVWGVCFAEWEAPDHDVLITMLDEAERAAEIKDELGLARERVKILEADQEEQRDLLRPFVPERITERGTVLEDAEPIVIGDWEVSRSTSIQRSFSLSDAEEAGYQLPRALEAFVKESWVERWKIKRVAGIEEAGDAPATTSDDQAAAA